MYKWIRGPPCSSTWIRDMFRGDFLPLVFQILAEDQSLNVLGLRGSSSRNHVWHSGRNSWRRLRKIRKEPNQHRLTVVEPSKLPTDLDASPVLFISCSNTIATTNANLPSAFPKHLEGLQLLLCWTTGLRSIGDYPDLWSTHQRRLGSLDNVGLIKAVRSDVDLGSTVRLVQRGQLPLLRAEKRPEIMPLSHIVDQHTLRGIGHVLSEDAGATFADRFQFLFEGRRRVQSQTTTAAFCLTSRGKNCLSQLFTRYDWRILEDSG